MENILAKKEKVTFCQEELEKRFKNLMNDLNGVEDDRSKYKTLYPFEYTKHVEINKAIMHHDIEEMIAHLQYMKEKIKHDETFLAVR
ncbi:MAG: hypothetical protein J6Y37_08255 [Paludibacteraceae bacterium]|nr:hypothetical protein [Paludibacteraceae bacterium]MBP5456478.1 hypothetical protein [Paludibacteraceae bacterium]MBR4840611.1 hypothetical protein [Paludibacteraceae bacterium]